MYLSEVGLRTYVATIWGRRHFLLSLVRMDLRLRYRRSALGIVWSLLNPLLMTAVLCFGFCGVYNQSIAEYAPFVLIGLAFWQFLNSTVQAGCQSLFLAEPYIRQYPAPLAMYSLRATLGAMTHHLIALGVAILLALSFQGNAQPAALIALVPALALTVLLGWAVATVAGFVNAHFPDTSQLLETGMQFLYFLTPIMYQPEIFRDKSPAFAAVLENNPLGWFACLLRDPILNGTPAPAHVWLGAAAVVAATAALATALLLRWERSLVFKL